MCSLCSAFIEWDPNLRVLWPVHCSLSVGTDLVLCCGHRTSKTGKHGHAKANITGIDIFTQRKYEDISPTSHNMLQPLVNRNDFQLVDVDDEAYVTLMDSKNETRSDLKLDLDGDDVHKRIKEEFDNGKDLVLTVLAAMKTEKIIAWKELQ